MDNWIRAMRYFLTVDLIRDVWDVRHFDDTGPNTQGKADRLMLKAGRTTAEIHRMTRQQRRAAERKARKEYLT